MVDIIGHSLELSHVSLKTDHHAVQKKVHTKLYCIKKIWAYMTIFAKKAH